MYQTLVGAWPLEHERLEAYVEKALREAKRNTSWVDPNEQWEAQVMRFCRGLYENHRFVAELDAFAAEVAVLGDRAALAQLVLRLTSPGVPDVYEGDELPYFALVDPDNRRPVDWAARRAALRRGDSPKLDLIRTLLALRARRPQAVAGAYAPLAAGAGTCAFRRGDDVVIAVAFRATAPELDPPGGRWRAVVDESYAVVYERA